MTLDVSHEVYVFIDVSATSQAHTSLFLPIHSCQMVSFAVIHCCSWKSILKSMYFSTRRSTRLLFLHRESSDCAEQVSVSQKQKEVRESNILCRRGRTASTGKKAGPLWSFHFSPLTVTYSKCCKIIHARAPHMYEVSWNYENSHCHTLGKINRRVIGSEDCWEKDTL